MTDKEFENKLDELLNDFVPYIKKTVLEKWKSGGINCSEYENNYLPVKICLCSALEDAKNQYMPYSKKDIKTVKNLSYF